MADSAYTILQSGLLRVLTQDKEVVKTSRDIADLIKGYVDDSGSAGTGQVLITNTDSTLDYVLNKIIGDGSTISTSVVNTGAYQQLKLSANIFADWGLTQILIIAVDGINGNDLNAGSAIAASIAQSDIQAAIVVAAGVNGINAKKTLAGASAIIPPQLAGRSVYIFVSGGTGSGLIYTDPWTIFDRNGGVVSIIGTGTNSTAGATAFTASTADLTYVGAQTAAGMNATGYYPTSSTTSNILQLTKVGGGSPSFGAEPGKPMFVRLRGDVGNGSTSNHVNIVVAVTAIDTIQLDAPITFTTSDIFYLEDPGPSATGGTFYGSSTFELNGIQASSTLTFAGTSAARMAFVQTSAGNIQDHTPGLVSTINTLPVSPNPTIGPSRSAGGVSVSSSASFTANNASLAASTFFAATGAQSIFWGNYNVVGSTVFMSGMSQSLGAFSNLFGGTGSTTAARVLGSSGQVDISLDGASMTFGAISLPNTAATTGITAVGTQDIFFQGTIFGGTKTNAGLDFSNSVNSRIAFSDNTFDDGSRGLLVTGANGDIYYGSNTTVGDTNIYLYYDGIAAVGGTLKLPNGDQWTEKAGGSSTPKLLGNAIAMQAYNRTGSDIVAPGLGNTATVVRYGVVGDSLDIAVAQADTFAHATGGIALALGKIKNNTSGFAVISGVAGIYYSDVSSGGPGAGGWALYLSDTVAGQVRHTPPSGGSTVVRQIGWAIDENTINLTPDNQIIGGGLELTGSLNSSGVGGILQRSALTGAITAADGSDTTAFGSASALSVLANATNASAVPSFLSTTSGSNAVLRESGGTLGWGTIGLSSLTAISANTLVGNPTSSSATPTTISLGTTSGVMQYVNGSPDTISMYSAGSQRIPFGSGTNGQLTDNGNLIWDSTNIGLAVGTGALGAAGNKIYILGTDTLVSSASLTWDPLRIDPGTLTLTGSTNITTATGLNSVTIKASILTSSSALTVTNSASLVIANAPSVSGSVTLTNPYAFWIQGGNVRLDGFGTTGLVKNTNGGVLSIAVSGTDYQPAGNYITALTGDVVATGPGSVVATIQTNVVTYAKMQQASAHVLLGNPTGSTANISEITLGSGLSFSGTTLVASSGSGTVTDVTGTAPIFITSTPTTTPNVTIQGSITSGDTVTTPQNLGSLTTGLLKGTVTSSINTISTAVAGTDYQGVITWPAAGEVLVSTGTTTTPTGDTTFIYDTTNHGLAIGATALAQVTNKLYIKNDATATITSSYHHLEFFVDTQTQTLTPATHITTSTGVITAGIGAVNYTSTSAMTIDSAASLVVAGAPTGDNSGGGLVTITNPYAFWIQGGNVRLDGFGTTGLVKNTNGGILSIGVAGTDYQGVITWPAAPQILYSSGTTTTPSGNADLVVDTSNGAAIIIGATNANNQGNQLRIVPQSTMVATSIYSPDTFLVDGQGVTITSPAHITYGGGWNTARFQSTTYTAGSAMTIDYAATVKIEGDTVGGTNVTITNPYALWIGGGHVRHDGQLRLSAMTGPALLQVDASGNVSTISTVPGRTLDYTVIQGQIISPTSWSDTFFVQGGAQLIVNNPSDAIEYFAPTVCGHITMILDCIRHSISTGSFTIQATLNGSPISGTSFTFGATGKTVIATAVATGSTSSTDTFGLIGSASGVTIGAGGMEWTVSIFLSP